MSENPLDGRLDAGAELSGHPLLEPVPAGQQLFIEALFAPVIMLSGGLRFSRAGLSWPCGRPR